MEVCTSTAHILVCSAARASTLVTSPSIDIAEQSHLGCNSLSDTVKFIPIISSIPFEMSLYENENDDNVNSSLFI